MENIFWSDHLAGIIINRKSYNHIDKKIKHPTTLVVKSSTSISGVPHIGNASDVIRHDALARSIKDKGKKVRFIWVAEDMDALRRVPAGIPPEFKKYLGMPVADIPCPEGCCKSYAEHFSSLFVNSLKAFGTRPDYLSTAKAYKAGDFTKWVKIVFENLDAVREIWNKYRKEALPGAWSPWIAVCENCGKIMTTKVSSGRYSCEDYTFRRPGGEAYTRLKGCGHRGDVDFKNGKLLWRVEWGMLWAHWKVIFEGSGKEHFMPSGSFWTAGEIAERIFGWPEPYLGDNPLQPYEYLTIDGHKMSASVGNTVATWEWPSFAPPQILRLLFLKRMRTVRDFSYIAMPEYVDEYDKIQRIYFNREKPGNEKEEAHLKRLYEMIETGNLPCRLPPQVPFYFASLIAQIAHPEKTMDAAIKLLKASGHVKSLTETDKEYVKKRLLIAKAWAERFAPEKDRIAVNTEPPELKLAKNEKNALSSFLGQLEKKDTQAVIYEAAKKNDVQPKRFFQILYQVLISRDSGPRAGPFIAIIGKKKVRRLIELALV